MAPSAAEVVEPRARRVAGGEKAVPVELLAEASSGKIELSAASAPELAAPDCSVGWSGIFAASLCAG